MGLASWTEFKISLEMLLLILLVYGIYQFLQYSKIVSQLKAIKNEIEELFRQKEERFNAYSKIVNQYLKNDFEFDINIASIDVLKEVRLFIQKIAHNLTDFENEIKKESNTANSKLESFQFEVTDFDSLAFSEKELQNIYSNYYHQDNQRFINENNSYSQFFRESLNQQREDEENSDLDLTQLKQSINAMANQVFNSKIENVRVMDLLHNRNSDFPEKINLIAKLKNLTHNSTPLLRTQTVSNVMPYTQKVLIGEIQNELKPKLQELLKNETPLNLEVNNQYIIGSFSHKYNFSISMVDDLRKQLTSKNQKVQ